jgi:D-beta-D-heptose 7-phosphate kinase/D-beta-D-heptose 1-phosphate adenosyltransferase
MSDLLSTLAAWRRPRVLIIGDVMLDELVHGAAERLSPDAPVPVLHATRTERRPGGASNVAACLRALEADVRVVAVVGDDLEGRAVCDTLAADGVDVSGITIDPDRPTTVKRSLVGLAQHRHPQKMFRIDIESREPVSAAIAEKLLAAIDAALPEVDIVCLEDYAKGVCTPAMCAAVIERCRAAGLELLVDPAAIEDFSRYRGATAITPNRTEAERATGMDTPIDASELHNAGLCAQLGRELDLEAVVLTLDRHGALLEERGGEPVHVPTVARSVYDVTGAGDMVLAALAAGRANRLSWRDAVEFANVAAGLEVEVFGVQPIPLAAVVREVWRMRRGLEGKLRTADEVLVEVAAHRAAGHRVAFTNGCFDVLHAGHVGYLREARSLGDVLIVAINGDAEVARQKGPGRPVYPLADRVTVLGELQCVDYVVPFEEPTVHALLRAVRPDVYVKGGDYRPEEVNEWDLVQELGLELKLLANRPGLGSTQVIEQLRDAGQPVGGGEAD